ncbi:flavin reductase family protein [Streptomyces clavifer]|uniref:flavin reductase family protein n=1 Tax=Streptomyces clavifer TaxID=68188 RepID=UPI00368C9D03
MKSETLRTEVASDLFRRVLGHFCTGLTVVTAVGSDGPVGFTCQSFTSLSLAPPLITIHPARTSTTWPAIRTTGRFCVNVLTGKQQRLAAAFARSGPEKFREVDWNPSATGSPMLVGALAWLDCLVTAEHDGGDHTIVVAAVEGLRLGATDSPPLLFYRGEFVS